MRARKRRYAEGTTVAVEKTKQEIETLVERNGGRKYFTGWASDHTAAIGFWASDRIIRLELELPPKGTADAETRRRWRCLLLCLKAQFESVATGIKTFEQAFFSDIVLPNDQTVYQAAHEMLAETYRTGKMEGRLLSAGADYTPPRASENG
jgi:hypothetical protein